MILIALATLGGQILLAILAWFAAPTLTLAWLVGLVWLSWWMWLIASPAVGRIAGGPWRRAIAILCGMMPLLIGSAWCLGGWRGWWPEIEAAAVVIQGLLIPIAPVLDLIKDDHVPRVAAYLWLGACVPWLMAVTSIGMAWWQSLHRSPSDA